MRFRIGQTVYWDENSITWSGTVVNWDDECVAVWLTSHYLRFLSRSIVRGRPEKEAARCDFVDDNPVGPTEDQRHHH